MFSCHMSMFIIKVIFLLGIPSMQMHFIGDRPPVNMELTKAIVISMLCKATSERKEYLKRQDF